MRIVTCNAIFYQLGHEEFLFRSSTFLSSSGIIHFFYTLLLISGPLTHLNSTV